MTNEKLIDSHQYLSFNLGDEVFAIPIASVREVLEFSKVTKVPKTPEFMMGVINLRGRVVPVVDMKLKFGMGKTEATINTCIIIVEIIIDEDVTVLGAVTDSVQEVIRLEPGEIEPAPKIGSQLDVEFIKGIGKKDDEFIIILEINGVFSIKELTAVMDSNMVNSISKLQGEERNIVNKGNNNAGDSN